MHPAGRRGIGAAAHEHFVDAVAIEVRHCGDAILVAHRVLPQEAAVGAAQAGGAGAGKACDQHVIDAVVINVANPGHFDDPGQPTKVIGPQSGAGLAVDAVHLGEIFTHDQVRGLSGNRQLQNLFRIVVGAQGRPIPDREAGLAVEAVHFFVVAAVGAYSDSGIGHPVVIDVANRHNRLAEGLVGAGITIAPDDRTIRAIEKKGALVAVAGLVAVGDRQHIRHPVIVVVAPGIAGFKIAQPETVGIVGAIFPDLAAVGAVDGVDMLIAPAGGDHHIIKAVTIEVAGDADRILYPIVGVAADRSGAGIADVGAEGPQGVGHPAAGAVEAEQPVVLGGDHHLGDPVAGDVIDRLQAVDLILLEGAGVRVVGHLIAPELEAGIIGTAAAAALEEDRQHRLGRVVAVDLQAVFEGRYRRGRELHRHGGGIIAPDAEGQGRGIDREGRIGEGEVADHQVHIALVADLQLPEAGAFAGDPHAAEVMAGGVQAGGGIRIKPLANEVHRYRGIDRIIAVDRHGTADGAVGDRGESHMADQR